MTIELVSYLVLSDHRKVQRGKKANAKVKRRGLWGSRGGTDREKPDKIPSPFLVYLFIFVFAFFSFITTATLQT